MQEVALQKRGKPLRAPATEQTSHICGCRQYLIDSGSCGYSGPLGLGHLALGGGRLACGCSKPAVVVSGVMRRGGYLLLTVQCITQAALCEGLRVLSVCLNLCLESNGCHPWFIASLWATKAKDCRVVPPSLVSCHRSVTWHCPPWRCVTGVSCGTSLLGNVKLLCLHRQPSPFLLGTECPCALCPLASEVTEQQGPDATGRRE